MEIRAELCHGKVDEQCLCRAMNVISLAIWKLRHHDAGQDRLEADIVLLATLGGFGNRIRLRKYNTSKESNRRVCSTGIYPLNT